MEDNLQGDPGRRPQPERINAFEPAPWLPGRHLQTIVPAFLPAAEAHGRAESRTVTVATDASLRLDINWPDDHGSLATPRATVVLVHGMGGSSRSRYMLHTTRFALARGLVVVRVNLRCCGDTAELSESLANASQSDDLAAVLAELGRLDFPAPIGLVGFSLGGNLVLRYGGRAGDESLADALVAVNPPTDLEACSRALEEPRSVVYQTYYTWSLCRNLRQIRKAWPVPGPEPTARHVRTVRRFDELYTAPLGGYASPEEYYVDASSGPLLGELRRPTLILSSVDDPVIPYPIFERYHGRLPGFVRFVHPPGGGHLGYHQRGSPRFWAGGVILDFIQAALGH